MVCIYCGAPTRVVNSRKQRKTNSIWRRRVCTACTNVFTSIEQPDLSATVMVEKPGKASLKPFNRDQLFLSIYDSCKHRPTALHDATSLTATVTRDLMGKQERAGIITRNQIVEVAHALLRRFDKPAATAYLAYHPLIKV